MIKGGNTASRSENARLGRSFLQIFEFRIAKGLSMKVGVDFLVDPSTISTEDAGGGKKIALEFHVAAYGADRRIAGQRDVAIKPTLKLADFARIQQQGLPYHVDVELPLGRYTLRLGVVDQHSGVIGTADMPLVLEGPQ
jgi:hypothetical protein